MTTEWRNQSGVSVGEWIERYRVFIGLGLIALILASGSFLAFRLNMHPSSKTADEGSEARITELEARVKELESKPDEAVAASSQPAPVTTEAAPAPPEAGKVAGVTTGLININTASLSELDSLPGIGPVYAQRIIDYRNTNGSYKAIDDVKNIKGIGSATFAKFKDKITVN